MKIARAKVQTEYIKFQGGLDLSSPALAIYPGSLMACKNYEAGVMGGYKRIDGYERYSGEDSPSDAIYYKGTVTLTGSVAVDDTVTGETSGATGVVSQVKTGYICITKVTGTFEAEDISVGGVVQGSFSSAPVSQDEADSEDHAAALNAAADIYRDDISAPTGSGPIRGIAILDGTVYCFRDNAGATAGLIYKATSSGWSSVGLYSEIDFASGVESIPDDTAVEQVTSGATATVKRTVLESGAWGSDAAGRLILDNVTGTFNDSDAIQVSSVTKVTASSTVSAISISPGGRYETVVHNFFSSLDTKRIYGCDGVNQGFEFDGDVYVPINTGMSTDTPTYVFAFKSQLFFAFKGSCQFSGTGTPYEWSAVTGSLEFGLGDDITGFSQIGGDALGIFARNLSDQLVGNNVDDFVKKPISSEIGCIPRTVQKIGFSYCLDDRGVIRITPSQNYGNFDQATISRLVQPLVDEIRSVAQASAVYKNRNQYRVYGDDGTGLCMTITDNGVVFTQFEYPVNVYCATSGEDSTGASVVFFGSDDGMVYQADKGCSFDGEDIEAFAMLPFNHSKSPSVLKSYLNATLEMSSEIYSPISLTIDFSYGNPDSPAHMNSDVQSEVFTPGTGGFWDIDNWDEFFYDAAFVSSPSFQISGSGSNMSLVVYSKTDYDFGHTLEGVLLQYIMRRRIR